MELEGAIFIPLSEETRLSVDKVVNTVKTLVIHFFNTDSLCRSIFHFNIAWVCYETCSTSFKG